MRDLAYGANPPYGDCDVTGGDGGDKKAPAKGAGSGTASRRRCRIREYDRFRFPGQ